MITSLNKPNIKRSVTGEYVVEVVAVNTSRKRR
jgi:ribosomal protein L23